MPCADMHIEQACMVQMARRRERGFCRPSRYLVLPGMPSPPYLWQKQKKTWTWRQRGDG